MTLGRAGRLVVIAVPLNFVWEMAQAPAFTGMPERWAAATAVCAPAAMGDGAIVLVLWAIGAMAFRDGRWFVPPAWDRYALVVLVGVGLQAAIEWLMVHGLHRWGYDPRQPLVPVLRVGVLPILQAVVLPPLVFWTAARWEGRRGGLTRPSQQVRT